MTYIDANVFIFAAGDRTPLGIAARRIIKDIQEGKLSACTCALTYDEVMWGVRKLLDKEKSYLAGELFLSLPHLRLTEVQRETITEAHHFITHFDLKPRDAIHLAAMRLENEKEIISEDPDFDRIPGIKRISLSLKN